MKPANPVHGTHRRTMLATTALALLLSPSPAALLSTVSVFGASLPNPTVSVAGLDDREELERALKLRNQSGAHWSAERYAEAAGVLKEALAIYSALNAANDDPSGHVAEVATTLRALVWNEFRAGQEAEALEHFEALVDLADSHDEAKGEQGSAYSAAYEHAGRKATIRSMERFWKAIAEVFEAYDDQKGLGQVMHDRASSYSALGDEKSARKGLKAAIKFRAAAGDDQGANWSRNNLGYSYLQAGEWSQAMGPIGDALAEIRAGRGAGAQAALGQNLLAISKGVLEGGRPDRKVVASLWKLAEAEASDGKPGIVAPERLLVAAMKAEVARVGAKRAQASVDRLLRAMPNAPASLRADLALHGADVLLAGESAERAAECLEQLTIEPGPVAPHLHVRRAVQRACAASVLGDQAGYDEAAQRARDLLEALGHDGTSRQGLERLADAAAAFPASDVGSAIIDEWSQLRRKGKPGGMGGSASSSDRSQYMDALAALGNQDPLFALFVRDGKLVFRDLLADDEHLRPMMWTVRSVSWNGLKLELFGGYIHVVDVNYGAGSGAKGARSGMSLRDMENFRPLDEEQMLLVTKTGATSYGKVAE